MFTGIITDIGTIKEIASKGDWRLTIQTTYPTDGIALGASIACSGICLTVTDKGDDWFAVEASEETRSRTTLGTWEEGMRINLERALKLGDELGGHLVSGHVDGVATILSITPDHDSHRLTIGAPDDLQYFIAEKGSVTLDGISLTVNKVDGAQFEVNIIPHTWEHTTLHEKKAGDSLNLEIDQLARYLARLNEKQE